MHSNVLFVLVNAVVQGLTEFFPVSSSGHLMLLQHFFKGVVWDNVALDVILHVGTLAAIVAFYWRVIFRLILAVKQLILDAFSWSLSNTYYERLLMLLIVSTAPLMITFFLRDVYKRVISEDNMLTLGAFFLFTALIMFASGKRTNGCKSAADMTYTDALLVGLFQALIAPLPGISRSGLTIAIGLLLGLSIRYCVMYSFLLGIPTVIGAGISEFCSAPSQINMVKMPVFWIGAVISAVIGYFCIGMLERIVLKNKFYMFAYYTFAIGMVTVGVGICQL